jgi:hypothetical protein
MGQSTRQELSAKAMIATLAAAVPNGDEIGVR